MDHNIRYDTNYSYFQIVFFATVFDGTNDPFVSHSAKNILKVRNDCGVTLLDLNYVVGFVESCIIAMFVIDDSALACLAYFCYCSSF